MDKDNFQVYETAEEETDTYDQKDREEKEAIPSDDVSAHWDARAKRDGVQAVMSARHTIEVNQQATLELQKDIFEFLEGLLTDKRVFELGVGIGRMTSELSKRAKEVVGIDMSPVMLEKARNSLGQLDNVKLILGKITNLPSDIKQFDLAFESIVLLHILNPDEVRATADKMREIAEKIFIVEHTYEGPDFPISKFTILRRPEEYVELFSPYKLVKQKDVRCAGDRFTMMLFSK